MRTRRLVPLLILMALFVSVVSAASAAEQWTVQSYTLLPQEGWTTGCSRGWSEGDSVLHWVKVTGFTPGQFYTLVFQDDYCWQGKENLYGIDYSTDFGVIGGILWGISDAFVIEPRIVRRQYLVTALLDGSTDEAIISWFGHLAETTHWAKGASWWPGASLDCQVFWQNPLIPGTRKLPHQVD